jgi:ABC-type branched-subunit amino acid transport system ATPase component/ABC-type branched-subunit amino acid transport system permease subunit
VFDSILLFFLLGAGTGAVYVLAAQGLVLIHRGSGVVNFANGGFALIGAYTFFELQESGIPEVPAIAIGMLAAAAAGAATHLLIMRRLKNAAQLTRVIATLALLALIQGAFIVKFQSDQAFPHFPLPNPTEHIFGQAIGAYYLFMLLIAAVLSAGLWAFYRYSAFGLKTSASAENGRSMAALGHSPDRLATWNWSAGGALAGLGGILVAPIVGLSVESVGLLLVPMLASALLGSFSSFSLTFLGGLVVGVGEAEVQRSVTTPGWPEVVPFFIVILVLVLKGSSLPSRSYVALRLPKVGSGNIPWRFAIPGFAGGVALCLLLSNGASAALIDTITAAIILLSSVVVTGYAGQLSLAQLGIAGIGAFIAARVGQAIGLNFWEALVVGMIGVIPIGIIIGLPALRARGVNLAIVTLGFGVIVEQVIFANSTFTGGVAGTTVQTPTLFGFDLNAELHPQRYAVLSLVLFALSGLAVCNLRRGRVGRRLVAVRGNERAAATLGINVAQTKLYAFSVAGVLATVGGVLIVYQASSVTWTSGWDVITGITLLSTIVIGGIGFVGGVPDRRPRRRCRDLGLPLLVPRRQRAELDRAHCGARHDPRDLEVARRHRRDDHRRAPGEEGDEARRCATEGRRGGAGRLQCPGRCPVDEAVVRDRHELSIEGLTVRFGGVVALDDVSFSVRSGEVVGLIGPNGAGKTTLIDAVTGITRRYTGHISVDGRRLDGLGPTQRARTGLARSFQSLELFDDLSVEENIRVAAESPPAWAYVSDLVWPLRRELGASAISAIKEFGLAGDLTKHPGELPFGRRRLVGIVRAIAAAPKIVLLDEPAAGLDQRESAELVDLLRHLAEDWNLGILLVEHDMRLVMSVCDRITALDFGQVIAQGSPDEVRNSEAVVTAYLGIGGAEGNTRTSRQSVAEVPESTPI